MTTKYTLSDLENDFGALTFGDLLLMERKDLKLTQVGMAEKLGITKQKLCDYEKGRRLPSVKLGASWAKKLQKPVESWVQVIFQDQLLRDELDLKVSVAS